MTSKITIEVDFDTTTPYIRVLHDRLSDDVRDKLLTQFIHKLGLTSKWCKIRFDNVGLNGVPLFTISPITPEEMKEEAELMASEGQRLLTH